MWVCSTMNRLDYHIYSELLQHITPDTEHHVDAFYQSTIMPEWQGKVLGINEHVADSLLRQCEFSTMDFSLGLAMPELMLPARSTPIVRRPSCRQFSERDIDYHLLTACLSQALCADETGRREYSSAGGLYSVDIFVALQTERLDHAPEGMESGFYYLDNNRNTLTLTAPVSSDGIRKALMRQGSYFQPATFQVITVINLAKALFKYKERGFRNALIEVGSIHHVLRECFIREGIESCESAEFYDPRLLDAMNLNKRMFKAGLVQHFGYNVC
ncbi:hypothetical protein BZG10_14100 [Salinivibrio kushneri]|nr:hypothetical protein BZG10_14100 [Salinivibrio kushneri]